VTQGLTPGGPAALVEDLTRRAEAATPPVPYRLNPESSIIARVERNDESLVTHNLERWLPEPNRNRGTATLFDPSDYVAYVTRLADGYTTVWGNETHATFTAVFNDHFGPHDAGWRDHTATLQLQDDPDWSAFLARDGKYVTQVQFGEFLQDYAAAFVQPDGATLLEIATNFKAHRKAEYSSAVDLDNGDVSLTYSEVTTAKTTRSGQIEIPKEFVVALSPFLGMPPVHLGARLRWNLDDGHLQIGYRLVRPDLVKRQAFADIRNTVADGTKDKNIAVLLGAAPQPVPAQH
jgi:uncharacterized protein YfdQ (DUF2303 family)